jgi:hypothetical protein
MAMLLEALHLDGLANLGIGLQARCRGHRIGGDVFRGHRLLPKLQPGESYPSIPTPDRVVSALARMFG